MDQLIVWAFVHHELTRRRRARPRCDDTFYRDPYKGDPAWLLGTVWSGLKPGR